MALPKCNSCVVCRGEGRVIDNVPDRFRYLVTEGRPAPPISPPLSNNTDVGMLVLYQLVWLA